MCGQWENLLAGSREPLETLAVIRIAGQTVDEMSRSTRDAKQRLDSIGEVGGVNDPVEVPFIG